MDKQRFSRYMTSFAVIAARPIIFIPESFDCVLSSEPHSSGRIGESQQLFFDIVFMIVVCPFELFSTSS